MTEYDRLRSIGCSVDTADALAPIVAELSDKKREAFYLWACGMPERQIAKRIPISRDTLFKLLRYIRAKCL